MSPFYSANTIIRAGGTSGAVTVSSGGGSGTTGTFPIFTGPTTIGDSILTQSGTCIIIHGSANNMTLCGSAAGLPTTITNTGTDANVSLQYVAKGSGSFTIGLFNAAQQTDVFIGGNKFYVVSDNSGTSAYPAYTVVGLSPNSPTAELATSNGTLAVPTATASGDILGTYNWLGYSGTQYEPGCSIIGVAEGLFSGASAPTHLDFLTTPVGTVTPIANFRIQTDGTVVMPSLTSFGWTAAATLPTSGAVPDTGLARNAAGVVEINNGTPGTLRDLTLRNLNYTTTVAAGANVTPITNNPVAGAPAVYIQVQVNGVTRVIPAW